MADENLNDAPEENANPNGAPTENAQQALDDLTVLSDIGNQSLGDSKLNLVRNVDVSDAALGGLANVHQGSGTGNQVQQGLQVQAGLIQTEEIVVEQAPPTPVQPPEVPPTETVEEEVDAQEIVDTAVNLGIQEDLSVANIVFGDGIPTNTTDTGDQLGDVAGAEPVVDEVIQDVIPAATLEDAFVDSQPVFGGIRIDVDPDDHDPTLTPVPSPVDWTEDKTLIFGVDASDPDGGDVIISFNTPEHGTMVINGDGTYAYVPDTNYYGDDNFTVYVTDDEGNVFSQVIELHIANVDDEAVVTVTGGVGTETTTDAPTVVTGQIVATDIDNNHPIAQARVDENGNDIPDITYSFGVNDDGSLVTSLTTAHGVVEIDPLTGAYTFTASDNNWGGTDSFTVVTTDSMGGTTEIEVPITVVGSDDQAVFTVSGGEGFESTSDAATVVSGSVGATDVDGAVTYSFGADDNGDPITTLVTDHGSVTIDPNTGAYTFTAADNNWAGSDSFTVVTTDSQGGTSSVEVPVTVTASDDEASFTLAGGTGAESTSDAATQVTGSVGATDVDGAVTYSFGADDNGDPITTLVTDHGSVTIDPNTGAYTFTAADNNWAGSDSFTVVTTDAQGGTSSVEVPVTVTASDDEARFTLAGGSGAESTSDAATVVSGSVGATDVDGAVTYSFGADDNGDPITTLVTDHGSVTIDPNTGAYTFTASDNNWAGSDSFTVVTTDSLGGTSTVEVPVTVTEVDDSTVVTGPTGFTMDEDGTITLTADQLLANASDVDSGLSVANMEVSGGTLVDNGNGTWTFTPSADFNGSIDLTYDVVSDDGQVTPTSGTIAVTEVEDTAVIDGPSEVELEVGQDGTASGDLDATDGDGDALTYGIVDPDTGELVTELTTEHGTVVIDPATGEYTFTPNDDMASLDDGEKVVDDFQVAASDGDTVSDPQNVTVTITGSNDGPVVDSVEAVRVDENGSAGGNVVGSDVDTSDSVSYYLVGENGERVTELVTDTGTVEINPTTGEYTFTPSGQDSLNVGDTATETFQVVAWDGTVASAPQDVSVTITGSDDATVVTGSVDLGDIAEDSGSILITSQQLLANASDVDNALSVANVEVSGGTLVDNGNGTWTFTPAADFNGSIDITYDVVTDDGAVTPATASLDVTAVEDEASFTLAGGTGNESTSDAATVVSGSIAASDVDGAVTLEVVGQGEHGSVTLNADGTYTFTAADNDWSGTDTFTVRSTDANGGVTEQQVTVTVEARADGVDIDAADAVIDLGNATNDTVVGTDAAETLVGGGGDDTVSGGAGADVIYGDGAGQSSGSYSVALDIDVSKLDSSESVNSVTISGVPDGASLSAGTDNGDGTWTLSVDDLDGLTLTVTQVDADGFDLGVTAQTADGSDVTLDSTSLHVSFTGGVVDGNDTLSGGTGDDTILGGGGNDVISGGEGADLLDGGAGNDVFTMGGSEDGTWSSGYVAKDVGDTSTTGTQQTVSITGKNQSDDTIVGGEGQDTLVGSGGNDAIFLDTGSGAARLDGVEVINAGDGADVVDLTSDRFTYGDVTVDGGSGNDVIWTSAGDDTLVGGAGNDSLNAGAGSDVIDAGSGNDTVIVDVAEAAGDVADGGAGTDTLRVEVSASEYTAEMRDEMLAFKDFMADPANAGQSFTFETMGGLSVSNFEALSVRLDGQVIDLNSPPDVVEAAVVDQTATEDQAFTLDVSEFFTDADIPMGDSLSFSLTFLDADGNAIATPDWVQFDPATGVLTGTPDNSDVGAFQIQVTATDESGATATTEPFTVSVADVDNAAEISVTGGEGDESTTDAATVVQGQIAASDADGGIVSFAVVAGGDHHGELTINPDGTFTFTAEDANWNGTDTFQVQLTDGEGNVYTQALTITVDPTNDAPVVSMTTDLGVGREDTAVTISKAALLANASDVDGDSLTAANISADHGTIVDNGNGTITFTPDANYNGEVTFSYTVSDGHGGTAQGTATLDLAAVNDGPVAQNVSDDGVEDNAITGQLTATDADGGTLSWSLSDDGAPAHGQVVVNADGSYTYTPADDWSGEDSFTVTVSDGQGGTTTQTVSVTVDAVADAPELSLSLGDGSVVTLDGNADEVVITSANMNDADSGFQVSAVKLDGSAGTLTHDQHGFGVAGASSGANVEIGQSGGNSEKIVVDFDSDVSSAQVSFGWLASNEQAHYDLYRDGVKVGEGTVRGITDYVDPAISVSAADGGGFDQIVFSAPGGGDNDYMINSITYEVAEPGGQVVQYPLDVSASLTDTDGSETLSAVTLTGLPDGAVILDASGNAVGVDNGDGTWTLPAGDLDNLTLQVPVGTDSFTLGATATSTEADTGATVQTATTSVTVNVDEFNVGPTTEAVDLGDGVEDTAIVISKADLLEGASDLNGDVLSAADITADHGTIVDNGDGTVTFTPDADYNGDVTFSYTVSDGHGGTASGTATLDLAAVNDGPTTSTVTLAAGTEDRSVTISKASLLANASDVDGDTLSAASISANHGTIVDNGNGTITFTPDANYNGQVTFSYTVSDGHGGTAQGTATMNMAAVNDGPTAGSVDLGDGLEDQSVIISKADLLEGASDVDGDTLSVSGITADHGTIVDNGDGTITFTPAPDYYGEVNFSYTISDGHGGTTTGTATLDLADVSDNIGPVAGDDSRTDVTAQTADLSVDVGTTTSVSETTTTTTTVVGSAGVDIANIADMADPTTGTATASYYNVNNSLGGTSGADNVVVSNEVNASINLSSGNDQLSVGNDVNSTVNLGSGDNALDVGDDINASVIAGSGNDTVRVDDDLNSGGLYLGDGDNRVQIGDDAHASIVTGSGNDTIRIGDEVNGVISTGSGDDRLQIGGDVNASLDMGQGNDSVSIGDDVSASITLGSGDDQLKVADDVWSSINAGDGNDKVEIGGDITANVSMGSGNDYLKVTGQNMWATLDGNSGTDSIELTGITKAQWDSNYNGIQNRVTNFENIKFSDGQVIGDASAFSGTTTVTTETTTTTYSTPITIEADLNDSDGSETLSAVTVSGIPAGATVALEDGTVLTANADGTYTVNVDAGEAVTLNVSQVGSAPDLSNLTTSVTTTEANGGDTTVTTVVGEGSVSGDVVDDEAIATGENVSLTLNVADLLENDSDADGGTLSIVGVGDATHGTVTLNPDGTITFVPEHGFSGDATFTYTLSDGQGGTDTATVTIEVVDGNDDPTITGTTGGVAAESTTDAATVVTGSIVASDADGDTLTYAVVDGGEPQHGSLTLNADGTYSYTADDNNWSGTDTFTVQVSDGNGGTTTQAVTITVTPEADTPTATVAATLDGNAVTVTNVGNASASYHSSYGYYIMDGDGNPTSGQIIWGDVQDTVGSSFTVNGVNPDQVGFFLIPNGDSQNSGKITDGEAVSFEQDANGNWTVVDSQGNHLSGAGSNVLFSDNGLNKNGIDRVEDNTDASGNQNWEDLTSNSDQDYNDANFNVETDLFATGTYENSTVTGTNSSNTLVGGAGSDSLFGLDGNDVLYGDNITQAASSGIDTRVYADLDIEYGSPDSGETFTFQISDLPSGVVLLADGVELAAVNGVYTVTADQVGNLQLDIPGSLAGSTISLDVTVVSHDGSDTASVTSTASLEIPALTSDGNDYIDAGSGNDTVHGGGGGDYIIGGSGNDLLNGGDGADYIIGGSGTDSLVGGAGNDTLVFTSGDGSNTYNLDGTTYYTAGDQGGANGSGGTGASLSIDGHNTTQDTFIGGDGTDTLQMTDGNDFIHISNVSSVERINAGAGNDIIDMNYSDGGSYNSFTLDGGSGNDTVFANNGDDYLMGGSGNDFMSGNAGNDVMIGGSGTDTMYGGSGNDTFIGGEGNDVMVGGDGSDTFLFDFHSGSADSVNGGTGNNWTDTLDLSDAVGQTFVITTDDGSQSWTITVDGENHGSIDIGRDVDGSVHLTTTNGDTVVDFDNIEQIKW